MGRQSVAPANEAAERMETQAGKRAAPGDDRDGDERGTEVTQVSRGTQERTGGCRWVDRQEQRNNSVGEEKERKHQRGRVRVRERE
jgi:hypothetical protein